jgi:hypothetical protein
MKTRQEYLIDSITDKEKLIIAEKNKIDTCNELIKIYETELQVANASLLEETGGKS